MFTNALKSLLQLFIDSLRKLSFSYRSFVGKEPSLWLLYQPYVLWGQIKRAAAGDNLSEGILLSSTELVIDGFQGSANSFATAAFEFSQTKPVKLMHHRHVPVLIIKAIENNVPVLLTIREPRSTALSVTSRWSHLSITQVLQSYIGFYSKLESYSDNYVISTFEQTTKSLDLVVKAINEKYHTNFDLVDVSLANIECRKKVSDSSEEAAKRKLLKRKKSEEFNLEQNIRLLEKANKIYESYEKLAQ